MKKFLLELYSLCKIWKHLKQDEQSAAMLFTREAREGKFWML